MRKRVNITIVPYGAEGFVVEWQMGPKEDLEFKTLQSRAQLMRLLELILDDANGDVE